MKNDKVKVVLLVRKVVLCVISVSMLITIIMGVSDYFENQLDHGKFIGYVMPLFVQVVCLICAYKGMRPNSHSNDKANLESIR